MQQVAQHQAHRPQRPDREELAHDGADKGFPWQLQRRIIQTSCVSDR